jgi:hypothetical protein
MKKRDIILISIFIAIAALSFGISRWQSLSDKEAILKISVQGETYGEYSLKQNQTIEIGSTNTCEIKDGKVHMIQADCPDKLCMDFTAIDKDGGSIVCLPNQVVLEIVTDNQNIDSIAG